MSRASSNRSNTQSARNRSEADDFSNSSRSLSTGGVSDSIRSLNSSHSLIVDAGDALEEACKLISRRAPLASIQALLHGVLSPSMHNSSSRSFASDDDSDTRNRAFHRVLACRPPLELVQWMVQERPSAVHVPTMSSSWLVLHTLCSNPPAIKNNDKAAFKQKEMRYIQVLEYLVRINRDGLEHITADGKVPLGSALQAGASRQVVSYLHEQNHHVLRGWLVEKQMSIDGLFSDKTDDQARAYISDQALCFMHADCASPDTTLADLQALHRYNDRLVVFLHGGYSTFVGTPIHVLCEHHGKFSNQVLDELLDWLIDICSGNLRTPARAKERQQLTLPGGASPEALSMLSNITRWYPIYIAIAFRMPLDALKKLWFEPQDEGSSTGAQPSESGLAPDQEEECTALHVACARVCDDSSIEVVRWLVDKYPRALTIEGLGGRLAWQCVPVASRNARCYVEYRSLAGKHSCCYRVTCV
jgi:hypothetical protein